GGGAVYHDMGNLNVSLFIAPELKKSLEVNNLQEITRKMTELLMKSLMKIGYSKLEIKGNSNIFYHGEKISGSAGYMYKNWHLHHATILESVNINHLNNSLLARDSNPTDNKKSRYFKTVNLPEFNQDLWINKFMQMMAIDFPISFAKGDLSEDEIKLTNKYVNNLYTKDFWIYKGKRKDK
ncbi:MAG: hypothetical protein HeimC2_28230, partial [Candidatus Heimdallarchaeota archaeon LC_2]